MAKPKILILCTGNSCRSHMAEAILRKETGGVVDVFSAGSNPAGFVHPLAIEALKEIGIDASGHTSKHLDQFLDAGIHTVIIPEENRRDLAALPKSLRKALDFYPVRDMEQVLEKIFVADE